MTLETAQNFAWTLAQTLLVPVTLIDRGIDFEIVPSAEFDGDPDRIVREYDPFAL